MENIQPGLILIDDTLYRTVCSTTGSGYPTHM